MNKLVFVRPGYKRDLVCFSKWATGAEESALDPGVMLYPRTTLRCAYDEDGPLMFMPVQRPLMMESLAVRPGLDEGLAVLAIKALFQDTITKAHEEGSGELYFLASEESVPDLALRAGWEEVPYKVYRLKVKDTERNVEPS